MFYDPNVINPVTKLPYVHVQTAGDVAGGAFYYQQNQVVDQPPYWTNKVKTLLLTLIILIIKSVLFMHFY